MVGFYRSHRAEILTKIIFSQSPSEVEGSQCADSAVTSRDSSTPPRFARNDQPHNHRAEAAVLTRLLYGRSEFVRAGNAVPLR